MTTEPKFIPKDGAALTLPSGAACKIRLIDCVGFVVKDAAGYMEEGKERMVKTPWSAQEIPLQRRQNWAQEKSSKNIPILGSLSPQTEALRTSPGNST